jgi:VanZ family protein
MIIVFIYLFFLFAPEQKKSTQPGREAASAAACANGAFIGLHG